MELYLPAIQELEKKNPKTGRLMRNLMETIWGYIEEEKGMSRRAVGGRSRMRKIMKQNSIKNK